MFERFLTFVVVGMLLAVMNFTPKSWLPNTKTKLADLWFDLNGIAVPAGAATDTSFGSSRFFDDFLGDTINTDNYAVLADTGGTAYAINLQGGGVIRGIGDGTNGDLTNIFGPAIWLPSSGGPLTLEIRANWRTSVADGENFFGFSDASTDENPLLVSTTDVLTSAASNAAGFVYTGAGTANWKAVSVNADSDGTVVACNQTGVVTTPVVGTWQTFKIVINTDGDADFYIDGVWQAREDLAVATGTLLNWGACQQDGGTGRSTDIDYVYISGGRV